MIRLVHLADTHLGVENYGRLDPATGLSSRLSDFLAALDQAVAHAVDQRADLVVFAGDAYKTRDPNPTHQREFARRIRRLCDAGIPCYLLVGNHDLPNAQSRAHTTEIFDTLAVDGVTVARKIGTSVVQTPSGAVQVVGLPWVTRGALLSKDEAKGRGIPELNEMLVAEIARRVKSELDALDPALPAILVGHCTVEGAVFGSERGVMLGQDLALPLSLLSEPRLDYVALGHLHKYQVVDRQPPVVYAGSLERVDFGEEGEEKGFVEVEIHPDDHQTRFRFVPVAARRFLTIEVRVDEGDPTGPVLEAIGRHDIAGSVVRVLVRGDTEVRLREADVRQALKEASFVASVSQEIEQRKRRRLGPGGAEGLTPIQALGAYLAAREVAPEHRQALTVRAGRLMSGGD